MGNVVLEGEHPCHDKPGAALAFAATGQLNASTGQDGQVVIREGESLQKVAAPALVPASFEAWLLCVYAFV
jgi:hypothetical protein